MLFKKNGSCPKKEKKEAKALNSGTEGKERGGKIPAAYYQAAIIIST